MWQASEYARDAAFVAELGRPLLDWLSPRPGERILDLGCGDGRLTAEIVARGAAVVGLDSSESMVEAARARALDARLGRAEQLAFHAEFDAVFSNAVLHWVADHDSVCAGVARALRPGGRFVGELGGHGNVAAVRTALRAALEQAGCAYREPWLFPTEEQFGATLARHGFTVERIETFPRLTPVPAGLEGWLALFAEPVLEAVPAELRGSVVRRAENLLAPALRDPRDVWHADYVRLRFAARK
jgi:SAM-dependent methyltransferase